MARIGERLRQAGAWIRRNPVKTAAALPLLVVLYVAAIYPFTPGIGDIRKSSRSRPRWCCPPTARSWRCSGAPTATG
jgi:hypothetical protein